VQTAATERLADADILSLTPRFIEVDERRRLPRNSFNSFPGNAVNR
jgi:hypothetical protein